MALYDAGRTIISSCGSFIELLQEPSDRLISYGFNFIEPRALHVAAQHRIADHLSKANQQTGLSAGRLSEIVGVEQNKLARVMRTLCSAHIFTEVQEDHFANNRISAALVDNDPLRAYIMVCGKHVWAPAQSFPEYLIDDGKGLSCLSPFQRGFRTGLNFWDWLEDMKGPFSATEPRTDKEMFALAMSANSKLNVPLYLDFPWASLGSVTVVDVGGGVGGLSMDMCRIYPNMKFIVQDLPEVIAGASTVWQNGMPIAVENSRVTFMPHDFFHDNPIAGADVYVLRRILHDWPDDRCVAILSHLRSALAPHSRLLVMEAVVNSTIGTPGLTSAPSPLPANYGIASTYAHCIDIGMLCLYLGAERTAREFRALTEKAGLEVIKIWSCQSAQSIVELRLPNL